MSTWMFDSLLVTSLLMTAILLIRRPVAKIFGAGVAYALWLIPAARLLMPSLPGDVAPVGESSQAVRDAVRESILTGIATGESVTPVATAPSIDFAALAITVWLGGAVLFFIVQMIRYASMRDDLLADAEELAVIDGVHVVSSDQVAGPLAFGLFKRFIAVPQNFNKTYSPEERKLAIAHEMAHHKSGDLFANLAAFIVLCLMWFNPLVWASWNAFRFDQEAACDARVLLGKCAEDRAIYGQALARTAFDGVPTFVTPLNSPKTVIERLRRLAMKDASAKRRSIGKFGILAAAAIILPLTATIVPGIQAQPLETGAMVASGTPVAPPPPPEPARPPNPIEIINISLGSVTDGKPNGTIVKRISRDGKIYVFRSHKKLSEDQAQNMIDETQASREASDDAMVVAEEARSEAEAARQEAEAARGEADVMGQHAAAARGHAEAMRVHAVAMAANYVPEIDIKEISKNCRVGQPVTTNVEGFDGKSKSRIKIVMCGKGQARVARIEAINGLRDARSNIASEKEIPERVRKDVIRKLEKEIRRLEAETENAG